MQYADLALTDEDTPGITLKPDGTVDADWFVIATAARVGGFCYLLDIYRAQIPFPMQVKMLKQEHQRWHSFKIGIEKNAYQWALGQAAIEKYGLPCVPVVSVNDKVTRAQMITPHFENGQVRLRGVMENGALVAHPALRRFIEEAVDFPFGDSDDVVDAVCGVIQMCYDEEIQAMKPDMSISAGMSVVLTGGRRVRGGDIFDVFRSEF